MTAPSLRAARGCQRRRSPGRFPARPAADPPALTVGHAATGASGASPRRRRRAADGGGAAAAVGERPAPGCRSHSRGAFATVGAVLRARREGGGRPRPPGRPAPPSGRAGGDPSPTPVPACAPADGIVGPPTRNCRWSTKFQFSTLRVLSLACSRSRPQGDPPTPDLDGPAPPPSSRPPPPPDRRSPSPLPDGAIGSTADCLGGCPLVPFL